MKSGKKKKTQRRKKNENRKYDIQMYVLTRPFFFFYYGNFFFVLRFFVRFFFSSFISIITSRIFIIDTARRRVCSCLYSFLSSFDFSITERATDSSNADYLELAKRVELLQTANFVCKYCTIDPPIVRRVWKTKFSPDTLLMRLMSE
jgi:hypothetical protein